MAPPKEHLMSVTTAAEPNRLAARLLVRAYALAVPVRGRRLTGERCIDPGEAPVQRAGGQHR